MTMLNCWPRITGPGIVCECGEFKIGGVAFTIARGLYKQHLVEKNNSTGEFEYGIAMRGFESEPHRWGMTKSEAELWVKDWEADAIKDYQRGLFYVIRRPVGKWERYEKEE
jgi:hypothetical protein